MSNDAGASLLTLPRGAWHLRWWSGIKASAGVSAQIQQSEDLGYVALPPAVAERAIAAVEQIQAG